MLQLWHDPQLRILLIISLAALYVAIIALLCILAGNTKSKKLKEFRKRLKTKGIPGELVDAFEELYEEIYRAEELKVNQDKMIDAHVGSLEQKIKTIDISTKKAEIRMTAILENMSDRQKEHNQRSINKRSGTIFRRLSGVEGKAKVLEERVEVIESSKETT